MSLVYTPGAARYIVAKVLLERGPITFESLFSAARHAEPDRCVGEVRYALIGMRKAGLAELRATDKRWAMTDSGATYWMRQHRDPVMLPSVEQPTAEEGQATRRVMMPCHADELYTRGLPRWSSPANRMPMVYRDGALDASALPRIEGTWRVWPDGRREPLNGSDSGKAA